MVQRAASRRLFEQALRYIPGGVNSPVRAFRAVGGNPFFTQRARGPFVYDVDENAYIDYVCGWGPHILGHAPAAIIKTLTQTAKQGVSFGIPNPLEVELAQKICKWVPSVQKVRMCNSGTEATMSCIRLARGYTRRDKIIKFEGCYHGHVDALLVKAGSGSLTLGQPDSGGIPASVAQQTLSLALNNLEQLEKTMAAVGEQVAGVILEPIPANIGLILPEKAFLSRLRQLCTQYGALLIFDEVMSGFRVARGGAQELLKIEPDLSAFGKVIGGGLPIGAFGGKRQIMDCLAPTGPVYQAGTLSGNPLTMAAGLAQLEALEKQDGFKKLEQLGATLEKGVRDILKRASKGYRVHRVGSMFSLFFSEKEVRNLEEAKKCDLDQFSLFFHHLLDEGIYIGPSQFETAFLSLAHTSKELEKTLEAVESFFIGRPKRRTRKK